METGNGIVGGTLGHVNHKVADLAVEVVLVNVPRGTVAAFNVDVGGNDAEAGEDAGCFDGRWVGGLLPHHQQLLSKDM